MLERFHLRKHKKAFLYLFLILFILTDIVISSWYILGWRPPFYDTFYTSKSIKKGTQWVVFGTVIKISKNTIFITDVSNKTTSYTLPKSASYYLSIQENDKEFSKGIKQITFILPKLGDWVGLNLFDDGNKNKFTIQAVFIMAQ